MPGGQRFKRQDKAGDEATATLHCHRPQNSWTCMERTEHPLLFCKFQEDPGMFLDNEHQLGACFFFRRPSMRPRGYPRASLGVPITGTWIFASIFLSPSHFLPTPTLFSPRVSLKKSVVEEYTNSHLICVRNHFTQSLLRSPCLFLEKRALSLLSLMPCPVKYPKSSSNFLRTSQEVDPFSQPWLSTPAFTGLHVGCQPCTCCALLSTPVTQTRTWHLRRLGGSVV